MLNQEMKERWGEGEKELIGGPILTGPGITVGYPSLWLLHSSNT